MNLLGLELDLSISLDQAHLNKAEQYKKAGFTAAECCLPTYYHDPIDLGILKPYIKTAYDAIRNSGLRIASWHIPFGRYWDISSPDKNIRLPAIEAHLALFQMLEPLDGANLVVHPSFEPIPENERSEHISACQESLKDLSAMAKSCGKRLALENLPRTCLGRTSQEMALLTRDGVLCDICMDTTHLFHEAPEDFLERCGRWVINTHLSDYLIGQDECHWVPGTGSLRWLAIFERLIALSYAGTYNFEVFHAAPLEILTGLKNALNKAG